MQRLRSTLLALVILPLTLAACAGAKDPDSKEHPAADKAGTPADADADADAATNAAACQSDADCVPVECCHPRSCGPAGSTPDCSDTMCTQECQPGTMDCGQGHCACQDGVCGVVMVEAPIEAQ